MRGPEELTTVISRGDTFIIRAEPAGMPQGFGMASRWVTLLSLLQKRVVENDRSWHLRVRRYSDDPAGPVVHHEILASAEQAKERLALLAVALKAGDRPWEPPT